WLLQEQFRIAGVDVQLDEVDFSLYNERARAGRFDALLNVWNTDPTPSSGFPQTWTPAGFGRSNYGRYDNPEVNRLVDQAVASAAIVFAVVTITFFVVHLAHGKPCGSDDRPLPPEICQALCRRFGCDKPLLVQYGKYLAALARGDLGESIGLHRPVADALADAIPNTFTLALAALLIDFALGLALGIYQAVRAGRFGDVAVGNVALLVNSMPVFW